MKEYSVLELSDDLLIIVLNDSHRIDYYLDGIRTKLRSMHFSGMVYIDLLLTNGLNSRRFFRSKYNDNNGLNLEIIPKNEKIPQVVLDQSQHYFSRNPSLLDKGILTSAAKRKMLLA
jgi:hypothetical protein